MMSEQITRQFFLHCYHHSFNNSTSSLKHLLSARLSTLSSFWIHYLKRLVPLTSCFTPWLLWIVLLWTGVCQILFLSWNGNNFVIFIIRFSEMWLYHHFGILYLSLGGFQKLPKWFFSFETPNPGQLAAVKTHRPEGWGNWPWSCLRTC